MLYKNKEKGRGQKETGAMNQNRKLLSKKKIIDNLKGAIWEINDWTCAFKHMSKMQ